MYVSITSCNFARIPVKNTVMVVIGEIYYWLPMELPTLFCKTLHFSCGLIPAELTKVMLQRWFCSMAAGQSRHFGLGIPGCPVKLLLSLQRGRSAGRSAPFWWANRAIKAAEPVKAHTFSGTTNGLRYSRVRNSSALLFSIK